MHNYILPIIWSFYTYIIGKAFPFIMFTVILFLFWIGGFDFPRAPITSYVIIFDIVSTICIRILMLQSIEYSKFDVNNDSNGKRRDQISYVLTVTGVTWIISIVIMFTVFDKLKFIA